MAARGVFSTLRQCIINFEEICSTALGLRFPHGVFKILNEIIGTLIYFSDSVGPNVAAISAIGWKNLSSAVPLNYDPFGLGDGFLWAVPKHRRTIERRLKRRFGSPGNWKIILPRNDLAVCKTCGHDHEIGVLCGKIFLKDLDFLIIWYVHRQLL